MIDVEAAVDGAMTIQGWKTREELIWIGRQAAKAEITIDVGCWRGRTTKVMASATRGIVIAVDHLVWRYSGETARNEIVAAGELGQLAVIIDFQKNLKKELEEGRVYEVFRDGAEAHAAVWNILGGEKADFVWIDGDHEYEDVKADILFYKSVLKSGGILSGHDYEEKFPGVIRAVNELCPGFSRGHGTSWFVAI
jgi:hypothetical protein